MLVMVGSIYAWETTRRRDLEKTDVGRLVRFCQGNGYKRQDMAECQVFHVAGAHESEYRISLT